MSALRFHAPIVRRGAFELAVGDVALRAGAITVLIGPNGGGKTTALRAASGVVRPVSGAVELDGEPVHAMAPARRAARIALVVQRPDVGAPFSVRDVVALGRVTQAADPRRVDEALRRVGLSAHADRPFHELSGGQQQRAAVARALAQHARGGVLLLDEAFAAVDPPEAAALVRELRIEAEQGATVLAATHDLAVASALADDVWCIAGGRTHAIGPAAELLAPTALEAFLGIPVARAGGARGPIAVPDFGAILGRSAR